MSSESSEINVKDRVASTVVPLKKLMEGVGRDEVDVDATLKRSEQKIRLTLACKRVYKTQISERIRA